MLYIIGLGLDKGDITLNGINCIKKCSKVYLERYTSILPCPVPELEKIIGKKVVPADRNLVEEKNTIVEEAKKQDIALLVMGDPLSATTHLEIIMRAEKMKVKTKIIHSVSVLNAVSETGLQLYKFGKTSSIPKWQPSFKPESFYDIIEENLSINAHTLLLIDIGLSVKDALSCLKGISEKRKNNITDNNLIICSCLGTSKQKIVYGKIDKMMKEKFELPACIIVPAKMHFMEEESIKKFL